MVNIKQPFGPSNYWNLQEIGHRPGYHDKPFVVKNLLASKIVEQILLMFKLQIHSCFSLYSFKQYLFILGIHLPSEIYVWSSRGVITRNKISAIKTVLLQVFEEPKFH